MELGLLSELAAQAHHRCDRVQHSFCVFTVFPAPSYLKANAGLLIQFIGCFRARRGKTGDLGLTRPRYTYQREEGIDIEGKGGWKSRVGPWGPTFGVEFSAGN